MGIGDWMKTTFHEVEANWKAGKYSIVELTRDYIDKNQKETEAWDKIMDHLSPKAKQAFNIVGGKFNADMRENADKMRQAETAIVKKDFSVLHPVDSFHHIQKDKKALEESVCDAFMADLARDFKNSISPDVEAELKKADAQLKANGMQPEFGLDAEIANMQTSLPKNIALACKLMGHE